ILTLTGQNTEISVLDLQSNYDQLHKVVQELANNLAIGYGVSPSQFRMTSQASSGFALQMENLKLDRFTLEQQADFKAYEQELFDMIKVVSEYYGKSVDGDMSVDFQEPNYPSSKSDQLDIDIKAIDMGLTSPHKVLMRNNPDLSEEDARIDVDDNINARNEMLNKVKTGGSLTDTMAALGIDANA
ncbi:MAG: phage portal protein, partial [Candidatus Thioglobus sp.]